MQHVRDRALHVLVDMSSITSGRVCPSVRRGPPPSTTERTDEDVQSKLGRWRTPPSGSEGHLESSSLTPNLPSRMRQGATATATMGAADQQDGPPRGGPLARLDGGDGDGPAGPATSSGSLGFCRRNRADDDGPAAQTKHSPEKSMDTTTAEASHPPPTRAGASLEHKRLADVRIFGGTVIFYSILQTSLQYLGEFLADDLRDANGLKHPSNFPAVSVVFANVFNGVNGGMALATAVVSGALIREVWSGTEGRGSVWARMFFGSSCIEALVTSGVVHSAAHRLFGATLGGNSYVEFFSHVGYTVNVLASAYLLARWLVPSRLGEGGWRPRPIEVVVAMALAVLAVLFTQRWVPYEPDPADFDFSDDHAFDEPRIVFLQRNLQGVLEGVLLVPTVLFLVVLRRLWITLRAVSNGETGTSLTALRVCVLAVAFPLCMNWIHFRCHDNLVRLIQGTLGWEHSETIAAIRVVFHIPSWVLAIGRTHHFRLLTEERAGWPSLDVVETICPGREVFPFLMVFLYRATEGMTLSLLPAFFGGSDTHYFYLNVTDNTWVAVAVLGMFVGNAVGAVAFGYLMQKKGYSFAYKVLCASFLATLALYMVPQTNASFIALRTVSAILFPGPVVLSRVTQNTRMSFRGAFKPVPMIVSLVWFNQGIWFGSVISNSSVWTPWNVFFSTAVILFVLFLCLFASFVVKHIETGKESLSMLSGHKTHEASTFHSDATNHETGSPLDGTTSNNRNSVSEVSTFSFSCTSRGNGSRLGTTNGSASCKGDVEEPLPSIKDGDSESCKSSSIASQQRKLSSKRSVTFDVPQEEEGEASVDSGQGNDSESEPQQGQDDSNVPINRRDMLRRSEGVRNFQLLEAFRNSLDSMGKSAMHPSSFAAEDFGADIDDECDEGGSVGDIECPRSAMAQHRGLSHSDAVHNFRPLDSLRLARLSSFVNGASFACHISLLPVQVTALADLDLYEYTTIVSSLGSISTVLILLSFKWLARKEATFSMAMAYCGHLLGTAILSIPQVYTFPLGVSVSIIVVSYGIVLLSFFIMNLSCEVSLGQKSLRQKNNKDAAAGLQMGLIKSLLSLGKVCGAALVVLGFRHHPQLPLWILEVLLLVSAAALYIKNRNN